MLANEWVAEGGRAKFATGRFLLFKRIPIFFASNFCETVLTTSTCSFDVFSEKDSNSIIRKTVHRTNIRLHFVSHPFQVLIQRCPFFDEIKQLGGEATCPGIAGQGAAKPRNLLIRKEKPSRAKFLKKRGAAAASSRRVPPGRLRVQENENRNRAEPRSKS